MRNLFKVLLVLLVSSCLVGTTNAQTSNKESLKTGIAAFAQKKADYDNLKSGNKIFIQAQFSSSPKRSVLENLSQNGIELLSYTGDKTYWIAVDENISEENLANAGVESIIVPTTEAKLSPTLKSKEYPEWASNSQGTLDVAIQFHEGTSLSEIENLIHTYNITVIKKAAKNARLMEGQIAIEQIELLGQHPLVAHLDAVQEPDQLLNYENRSSHNVHALNSANGYNLKGSGVVIGIGDGGELGDHIDFGNRVINYASGTYSSFGAHGDHVAGIIGGGGTVNPRHAGMAPEATLITQKTSLISYYTPDYIEDHGMVLTNNSYGTSFDCGTNGVYNYTSSNLDAQSNDYPELLHVFAAGNSGGSTCAPFPQGYKTVLRYYQASKNVLTVGNLKEDLTANTRSSRGPVDDGRLKPEICAIGTNVYSVDRDYGYWKATGTSMSAPTVTGIIGLMVEKYRNDNSGENPDGGLMKAIACNTADDLGNVGPDYIYGFGSINAQRAVETIEENRFILDNIATGESKTHTIDVGADTRQLKVMLYWTDKEAQAYPEKVLINDLNLEVKAPSGTSYLPWVLNADPEHVADLAERGVDSLNNIEQVTINTPAAGQYEIKVNGFDIPVGPQNYYIVFEAVDGDIDLTYPMGSENMEPGKKEMISWNAEANNTSTFKIEYSINNGTTWTQITDNILANVRQYSWTVPAEYTEQGKIRVSKNGTNNTDVNTVAFSIMTAPTLLEVSPKCEGRIFLEWEELDYASEYEILMYDGTEMTLLASVSETSYLLEDGFDIGEMYWFSIRAVADSGAKSAATLANSVVTEFDAVCPWENEGLIKPILVRKAGRVGTNSVLGTEEEISVIIKNLGTENMSDFTVYCQMNDGDAVSQVVPNTILPGDSLLFVFDQTLDCSAVGEYEVKAWLEIAGDTTPENDSLTNQYVFVQIDNDAATLPFENTFENIQNTLYTSDYLGIEELNHWDFKTSGNGFLETKAAGYFMLASTENPQEGDFNEAIMTLDMTNYSNTNQRLILSFEYGTNDILGQASTGAAFSATNSVFVRGNDMEDWLKIMDLENRVDWNTVDLLDLTALLSEAGQSLSSSAQIKFSQLDAVGFSFKNIDLSLADPLPVELSYFKVRAERNDVIIDWQTASEFQNSHFEVQVGAKTNNQIEWRTIGKVEGQGNSSQINNYQFIDDEKDKKGERYYRLVQVDFNGDRNLSPIRVLQFSEVDKPLEIYPNPFVSSVTVHYESNSDATINIEVMNAIGIVIDKIQVDVYEGSQDLPLQLDSDLSPGLYYLKIDTGNRTQTYPINKVDM